MTLCRAGVRFQQYMEDLKKPYCQCIHKLNYTQVCTWVIIVPPTSNLAGDKLANPRDFFNKIALSKGFNPAEEPYKWNELTTKDVLQFKVCNICVIIPNK